ncbi:molybdenum cofactor biosynthesis protein B [Pollutimonas thiosulfatoxidans]|uniref:Molybdenum cofactor biosynthesis protein B n=1 Tax=Pollutimonas thiosulfatoxidans TaxID=2028345 RepID=A0A410G8B6_9BURK|nr:molybdenum cofactor biosynthesis protein B [Pollutimonas thiosulfatoxidans]QAA92530.1 molybdenum cofactor biosynthesis protein B [Pollutimonas thiosulfatoxidans]
MSKARTDAPAIALRCAVLTISDTRTADSDSSGDYLAASLAAAGHQCTARAIVPGNLYGIRRIISDWIADDAVQVILTNGGTGYSHQKSTVAAITPLLDQLITGFGELFRQLSYRDIGSSALQSEAFAGVANETLVFCMPGSTSACKTAWEGILREQLDSTHRPCNFASDYHHA